MGYIGTYCTSTTAPEHHCNTFGEPKWSGKHESEFTYELEADLRDFIEREAIRKGNNDAVARSIDYKSNMFHPNFLYGWPYRLWAEQYQAGVDNFKARCR